MNKLADRKKAVLLAIITEYIKTAKPISSKQLVKQCSFNVSPATLRSIMASLESDGFLTHPHTSAGRVPTVMGYRYYVDRVSKRLSLGLEQRRYIIDFFAKQVQLEELLKQTSKFIAQYTSYLGIVMRYSDRKLNLKHIDLVPLGNGQLLMVIITKTGDVYKDKLFINRYDFDVKKIEDVLNKEFSGLDLDDIEDKCQNLKALQLLGSIFEHIADRLIRILKKEQISFYYDGITNLLNFPEFSKINRFSNVLSFFEDDYSALNQISANLLDNHTYVAIGDELTNLPLADIGLVIAPYSENDQLAGAVGIVGPMRMDYEKAIATTECIAGNLSIALQRMN